jgi:L-rhamnonate dehydratase
MATIERIEVFRLEPPPAEHEGTTATRDGWGKTMKQATPFDRFEEPLSRHEPGGIIWVKATASDGTFGLGSTDTGNTAAILIEQSLAPAVIGQEVGAVDACNDRMWHACISFGMEGLAARAVAGVDLALWDLWGKSVGEPVYRLAGGPQKRTLPCYVTGNDVDWGKELGFNKFKLARPASVYHGQAGIDNTAEMIAKARETVGDDADLMLDCWMAYDVDYGVRMCEALRPYRMAWIEEMLPYWNYDGYKALRQRVPWQTMATGEHWSTKHTGIRAVRDRLVDLIQADLKWIGGFTEAMKLAHAADACGIPMCLHTGANELFGQHWSFAAPNVHLIEYIMFSDPGVPLQECYAGSLSEAGRQTYRAIPGTPIPNNGVVSLPPGPGFGINLPERWLIPWSA